MNIFSNTNNSIAYTVSKAAGNNDLYISVQNGGIVVNAPWYYSRKRIQEVIEEKKKWIVEKLQECEEKAIEKKDFPLPKFTKILGTTYSISVYYSNIENPTLNFENDCVSILLPNKFRNTDNTVLVKTVLDKMYFSIAQNEIENIMEKTRLSLRFAPEDFKIKKIKKQLASFSEENKTISVNPDIVKYKKPVIEFIILHQFCHIKYKTHSKKFTELMKLHSSHYERLLEKTQDLKF